MTYTACKFAVKSELHPVAFTTYIPCRIFPCMEHGQHHLRAWREFRGYTQKQVMDRIAAFDDPKLPRTEVSLSRVETGQQIYTERLLMALAEVYQAEPWELLTRNPFKDGQIFDLLPKLNEKQMERATALIAALLKTG